MIRIILDTDLAMGAPGSDIDDGFALALAHADPDIRHRARDDGQREHRRGERDPARPRARRAPRRRHLPVSRARRRRFSVPTGPGGHPMRSGERYGHRSAPAPGMRPEIVELVMANPGEITVVAIGPLTNIAVAMSLEPRLAATVKEIVIMGGIFFGNERVGACPASSTCGSTPRPRRRSSARACDCAGSDST